MANEQIDLAIIGGSGLYSMKGLEDVQTHEMDTPFGKPSSPIVTGRLDDRHIAFLARHGIGHFISPSEVNYRANIYALRMLGCRQVVSISACGSLREDYAPGDIVIPDQLFDFTRGMRKPSFFGNGLVVHISSADPFCPDLSKALQQAVEATGATVHSGGVLVTIEGPRFSTKAESNFFRMAGFSIIGMTACPEAFLAREAEMCYATMGHVTDYDTWHVSEAPVTVEMVLRILNRNTDIAQDAVRNLVSALPVQQSCSCRQALSNTFITNTDLIPEETRKDLDLLIHPYFKP